MKRREFLKWAGAAAVGGDALAARSLDAMVRAREAVAPPVFKGPLGVQLYTVREQAAVDLPRVLAAIAQIGYKEVETYWDVYNRPAKELRALIADHGLTVPSGHFNYDGLESKIDYARELGVKYMICPMLPQKMWASIEGFEAAAAQLNAWGEKVKKAGMQLGFHNHNYEFKTFGSTTGFATLMRLTDPSLVVLEMDCYWMTQAGESPITMLQKYGKRIKMLHLKDRKSGFATSQSLDDAASHFEAVGSGAIDWKSILMLAQRQGVEHYFVERDSGSVPALESLALSYKYLTNLQ
ncbi:MAG: sugar phosphate isomerase/epimerase [Candidatus Acidiferrales bacterium]|jgi:sugar phosphate isomerase/epimerase